MPSHPRPILKKAPATASSFALPFPASRLPFPNSPHHVHFASTPTLTHFETTHSSFSYDRKPIMVVPNSCAMPARGERDLYDSELEFSPHKTSFHHHDESDFEVGDQLDRSPSWEDWWSSSPSINAHFRAPQLGSLDGSEMAFGSPTSANFHLNTKIDICQHRPRMERSLTFLAPKVTLPKKRTSNRTSNFERARKVLVSNATCGSLASGFREPGLDGCLGGF